MFMVMAAVTYDGSSNNSETCFKLNAINLATMAEARAEADFRNKAEQEAGHTNVQWFPCKQ